MSPSDRRLGSSSPLAATDTFARRHLGSSEAETAAMLETVGAASFEELIAETVPAAIRRRELLELEGLDPERPLGEYEALAWLRSLAKQNRVMRSFIGQGYHGTLVPPVILRNILENPGWYTQYTPYQAEISQGRLEALLTFQTMIADLTGLPMANASLLDEGTAAAEAMAMAHSIGRGKRNTFLAAASCHPQTLAVLETRAKGFGFELRVEADLAAALAGAGGAGPDASDVFGVLVQNPATDGSIADYSALAEAARAAGVVTVFAVDLLALTVMRSPGEMGADIAIGSAQRFGVPMGFGGPHAAFLATRDEHKRLMPGRIIGVSRDARGKEAFRMSLQTREQHIRREKATSNICTAQVLLAIMAGMYAVYHGPEGLEAIARRVRLAALVLAEGLSRAGLAVQDRIFFDTVVVSAPDAAARLAAAAARGYNLRLLDEGRIAIALDETVTVADLAALLHVFGAPGANAEDVEALARELDPALPELLARQSDFLGHPVFHRHHTEHEMLRFLHRMQSKDLSLTTSMIPLGSCTMKLNATVEMIPVTWPELAELHPFAPAEQTAGYREMFRLLESWLAEITGFAAVSLQPNAGAQGEYAGLMAIRARHEARGEGHRKTCLIPVSAHGTNPASAVMIGYEVVVVACDENGNVDLGDLRAKAEKHAADLAAFMITYPSTHGVFEEAIREICEVVHRHGGLVYLDGANMNAQVGLSRPGDYGADVCHLNLHKTFCIPHGGGGPGMGPICVSAELAPFLPNHPVVAGVGGEQSFGAVSAAPWGSAAILPIPWTYIALMGAPGLRRASELAILNANYMARRLAEHYPVLYQGREGRCAHEFILDLRPMKAWVEAEDVAKRLMDFGFHAPTMSFPVVGTLMIEPTESESKAELDRFCDAMIQIREEIRAIAEGRIDAHENPLKNAPHTADVVLAAEWNRPYSREEAAFPLPWVRERKFWPSVARIDNVWGDRNLVCICPPTSDYEG